MFAVLVALFIGIRRIIEAAGRGLKFFVGYVVRMAVTGFVSGSSGLVESLAFFAAGFYLPVRA
ncbi:MAG: hypothetical protein JO281_15850 [Pseudonocardiales bacterium]|nr:hypothetical protein [Pseudonocardiales bacterium]